MIDRFKFRAWNGFIKEPAMIYDVQKLNGYSSGSYHPIEQFITNMVEEDVIMNSRDFQNLIDTPAYTIMQCVGVRDKNNNLIFEGDLLKYKACTQEYLLVVSYDKEDLQFKFFSKDNNSYPSVITSDGVKSSIAVVASFELSECEVVGNIYENPELLTNDR
jgi:uncharacterized phage protein (TIGR01671 family)